MSDAPRANVGRLKRLVRWLITEPPEDAIFGTNIRQAFHAFHLARGHRWVSDRKYVRRCSACGEEQWMMVSRLTGERTWEKISANIAVSGGGGAA
jgi:hypothetical protein